jgi:transposase
MKREEEGSGETVIDSKILEEYKQLKKDYNRLKEENAILKKYAAILSKDQDLV